MAQRRGRGNIWRLCLLPPSWSLQKLKTIWNNQNFFTHPQSIKMLLRLTWNKHNSVVVAHGLGVWRRSEKKHFFSCTSCTLKSSEKNEVCKHMRENNYLSLFYSYLQLSGIICDSLNGLGSRGHILTFWLHGIVTLQNGWNFGNHPDGGFPKNHPFWYLITSLLVHLTKIN